MKWTVFWSAILEDGEPHRFKAEYPSFDEAVQASVPTGPIRQQYPNAELFNYRPVRNDGNPATPI